MPLSENLVEDYLQRSIYLLNAEIEKHNKNITKILTTAYTKPQAKATYWNAVRKSINAEYKSLDQIYKKWAKINISKSYRYSVLQMMEELNKNKSIAKLASKTFSDMVTSPQALKITDALYKDAISDWTTSLTAGQNNIERITRRTQQGLIKESFIDKSVAKTYESGNLLNNTFYNSINLENTLASEIKKISEIIENKWYVQAGSKRFKANYYAEMVTRVKFHEAQSYGALQTAKNYETDLIQVSSHNTTTEICQQYENKIYSISGKDPRFPALIAVSPFHVNCLHNMFPVFESGLDANNNIDKWSEFSQGKINSPPGKTSFIPIADRLNVVSGDLV